MNKYNIERVSNVKNYIITMLHKTPLTINTFINFYTLIHRLWAMKLNLIIMKNLLR